MNKLVFFTFIVVLILFGSCQEEEIPLEKDIDFPSEYNTIFQTVTDSEVQIIVYEGKTELSAELDPEQLQKLIVGLKRFFRDSDLVFENIPVSGDASYNGRTLNYNCDANSTLIYNDGSNRHYLITQTCYHDCCGFRVTTGIVICNSEGCEHQL